MDSVQTVLITLLRISAGILGMKYQLIFTLLFFLVPPFLFFPNLYFLLIFKIHCMLMLNWELFNLAFHCTIRLWLPLMSLFSECSGVIFSCISLIIRDFHVGFNLKYFLSSGFLTHTLFIFFWGYYFL